MTKSTCGPFSDATEDAIARKNIFKLLPMPDVDSIMRILDAGQIRILNNSWDELQTALLEFELRMNSKITVPVFLIHFHSYE